MSIGENIKRLRIKKKMTQKELGEKIGGVAQQQIGQWENGKNNPKLNTIKKIADALQVSVNDILEGNYFDSSPAYRAFERTGNTDSELFLDLKNSRLTGEIGQWEPIDIELVKKFKTLNDAGQAKAIERVEELAEIPRYTKREDDPPDERK